MPKKVQSDYIAGFTRLGYSFKMNEMDDSIECNGQRLSDGLAGEVEVKMIDSGLGPTSRIRQAWIAEAYANRYHPIKDYLNSLQWVGEDMLGSLLGKFDFHNTNDARVFIRKWLLGCIGKVLDQEQNRMLVIDGKQGLGKSYFARWLAGDMDRYFVEGALNPDSNDTKLRIISNWIWEVGELQYTTRKADVEALKNIISQKWMTVRPPYNRHDIEKPIIANFIGTINETGAGFLNDPTGTRRFAVVKVNDIDWGYTKLNVEQLWAQMMFQYGMGERGVFTPEEEKRQEEINAEYDTTSTAHELLLKYYYINTDENGNDIDEWCPLADIVTDLEFLGLKGNQYQNQKEIASILTKMECPKSRSHPETGHGRRTCYHGIRKKKNIGVGGASSALPGWQTIKN